MNISQYQSGGNAMEKSLTSLTKANRLVAACNLLGFPMDLYATTVVQGLKWLPTTGMPNTGDPLVDAQNTVHNLDGFSSESELNYVLIPSSHPVTEEGFNAAQMLKELDSDGNIVLGLQRLFDEINPDGNKETVIAALARIPGVIDAAKQALS